MLPPIPAVLIAILSTQAGAAIAKTLFPTFGPAGTTGLRTSLAAALLFALYRPPLHRLTRAHWLAVIPYGVALGAMNLSYYLAIQRIPLGLAVTLELTGPLAVALLGSRRLSDLLWVGLAASGIALLAPWPGRAHALDPVGVGLALLAAACWAAYILLGVRLAHRLPVGHAVALGTLFAALTVMPLAAPALAASTFTLPAAGIALAVAVLASALPYTLELVALKALPSKTFGVLMSLEPAVAALMGWLFLREQLAPGQWLAVACVSAASVGAALTAKTSNNHL